MELRLKWWQAGIYELSLFSLGAVVGARWFNFFQSYSTAFLIIFLSAGGYILWLWIKQLGERS